ncbi:hypothetical protein ECP03047778_5024 [Escherichia coli P0304777.8]|nr:hypothetical protein ECP03047778_5024 [Escherichia coli P0304777.8]
MEMPNSKRMTQRDVLWAGSLGGCSSDVPLYAPAISAA